MFRPLSSTLLVLAATGCVRGSSAPARVDSASGSVTSAAASAQRVACAPDNGGITLPAGFCASVFADTVPGARHMAVAPNGDVFVASRTNNRPGIFALRDADKDGVAERRMGWDANFVTSEVALFDGYLYTENGSAVFRYPLKAGALEPSGPADTIVAGLPSQGGHRHKTFAIDREGQLFVNLGSSGNVCPPDQSLPRNRQADPCPQLQERAGIWRFDARKTGQRQSDGVHFARGIRNAVAITVHPVTNQLWVAQHGRDNLQLWTEFFTNESGAELPSEELFQVNQGDDFGWPYCYYDHIQKKKLLAPEYGGDAKTEGRCASLKSNVAAFPGHWAPNAILFYTGNALPARYKEGVFIAFHGSWNRAPLPQAGFNVVFQPLRDGRAAGPYEVFADGFATTLTGRGSAGNRRPTGLAQGPDGALYVSDDGTGRIWKIVYAGSR